MEPYANWTLWPNESMGRRSEGAQEVFDYVEVIYSPTVCLIGTLLNLMAVGAFLSKPLRRISCCLYLATRSLAVFGFLITVAITWSVTFTTFFNTDGVCEVTIFLSYFCTFLSVWMVVIISFENFIRIAQPSRVSSLCNPRVARYVIAAFCVIGLAVYNFALWTSGVIDGTCTTLPKYKKILLIFNYVDTTLTLVAPFTLLIVLVPLVALTAIHSYERKRRLAAGRTGRPGSKEVRSTPETRVTHLLLAVSVVFLMLHTPFHAIRIRTFILVLAEAMDQITETDQILHKVFRLVYNLDTCASCVVYLIFGDNFRRVFYNMYFSGCHRGWCRLRGMRNAHVVNSETVPSAIEISNVESTPKFRSSSNVSTTLHSQMNQVSTSCVNNNGVYSNNINSNATGESSDYIQLKGGLNHVTTDVPNGSTNTARSSALLFSENEDKESTEQDAPDTSLLSPSVSGSGSLRHYYGNKSAPLIQKNECVDDDDDNDDDDEFGNDGVFDQRNDIADGDVRANCDEETGLLDVENLEKESKRGLLSSESVDV